MAAGVRRDAERRAASGAEENPRDVPLSAVGGVIYSASDMPNGPSPGPPRDKEVVAMPQWPIRVKLIAGLTLVVGMMLTLMGGSIFGLHAFHTSNLTLVDQLRELGASKDLLQVVVRLEAPRRGTL